MVQDGLDNQLTQVLHSFMETLLIDDRGGGIALLEREGGRSRVHEKVITEGHKQHMRLLQEELETVPGHAPRSVSSPSWTDPLFAAPSPTRASAGRKYSSRPNSPGPESCSGRSLPTTPVLSSRRSPSAPAKSASPSREVVGSPQRPLIRHASSEHYFASTGLGPAIEPFVLPGAACSSGASTSNSSGKVLASRRSPFRTRVVRGGVATSIDQYHHHHHPSTPSRMGVRRNLLLLRNTTGSNINLVNSAAQLAKVGAGAGNLLGENTLYAGANGVGQASVEQRAGCGRQNKVEGDGLGREEKTSAAGESLVSSGGRWSDSHIHSSLLSPFEGVNSDEPMEGGLHIPVIRGLETVQKKPSEGSMSVLALDEEVGEVETEGKVGNNSEQKKDEENEEAGVVEDMKLYFVSELSTSKPCLVIEESVEGKVGFRYFDRFGFISDKWLSDQLESVMSRLGSGISQSRAGAASKASSPKGSKNSSRGAGGAKGEVGISTFGRRHRSMDGMGGWHLDSKKSTVRGQNVQPLSPREKKRIEPMGPQTEKKAGFGRSGAGQTASKGSFCFKKEGQALKENGKVMEPSSKVGKSPGTEGALLGAKAIQRPGRIFPGSPRKGKAAESSGGVQGGRDELHMLKGKVGDEKLPETSAKQCCFRRPILGIQKN